MIISLNRLAVYPRYMYTLNNMQFIIDLASMLRVGYRV